MQQSDNGDGETVLKGETRDRKKVKTKSLLFEEARRRCCVSRPRCGEAEYLGSFVLIYCVVCSFDHHRHFKTLHSKPLGFLPLGAFHLFHSVLVTPQCLGILCLGRLAMREH